MKDTTAFEAQRRFYEKCCDLLELPQYYKTPEYRLTRWNNRSPGNGRMTGFGQIRMYAPTFIHVCLRHPKSINEVYKTEEEVYDLLRSFTSS